VSPDQVHEIIYSENQAYTDPWKHQRSKHPLLTGHTRRAPFCWKALFILFCFFFPQKKKKKKKKKEKQTKQK
jgi:hypothetical protein